MKSTNKWCLQNRAESGDDDNVDHRLGEKRGGNQLQFGVNGRDSETDANANDGNHKTNVPSDRALKN